MIARNKNKMDAALEKLKFLNEKQQIKTKAVIADFTECQNPDFFLKLFKEL